MSQDWTEKYRPTNLNEVVGNPKAVSDLRAWATAWNNSKPSKKAVILMGDPGIGKTSAAIALAKEMEWGLVEMNASDQRSGDAIRSIALKGAYFNTFSADGGYLSAKDGGRKLVVLDEADNLFGREDRGALPAINELIRETKQPVILIVNDFYALSKKSAAIKTETLQISFMRPKTETIIKVLRKIATAENVEVEDSSLRVMAENSNGDLRAAVRNLESLALGRSTITESDTNNLSDRLVKKNIYDLMNATFRKNEALEARRLMRDVDETPDHIMLWMDENLPHEYKDPGDLVRGYEKLSKADIFLGRVHRRQYYGMWSYAGDMMSAGLATAKFSKIKNVERFRFPMYLMKMSRSKGVRATKDSVCMKLAVMMHTSTKRISQDVLPALKEMLRNDAEFRIWLVNNADLEAEELAFILNEKIDSKIVKDAIKGNAGPVVVPDVVEKKATPKPEPPKAQKSLFQF